MAGLIRRIAIGKILPLRPGAQNPEHTVQHFARIPPRSAAAIGTAWFDEYRLQNLPLSVFQIHSVDRRTIGLSYSAFSTLFLAESTIFYLAPFMRWVLGILDLLGIRKINNLRIINTPCKTDPDQVHHFTRLESITSRAFARIVQKSYNRPDSGDRKCSLFTRVITRLARTPLSIIGAAAARNGYKERSMRAGIRQAANTRNWEKSRAHSARSRRCSQSAQT